MTLPRADQRRPLSSLEVDTIRVALALLLDPGMPPEVLDAARGLEDVEAIANDVVISALMMELEHASVVTIGGVEP